MAVIVPFRGISYNPQKINDLSKVVAPPYDVNLSQEQDSLYQRHPQNVCSFDLNKENAAGSSERQPLYPFGCPLPSLAEGRGSGPGPQAAILFFAGRIQPFHSSCGQTVSTSGTIVRQVSSG